MNLMAEISLLIIAISLILPLIKKRSFVYSIIISNFILFFISSLASPDYISAHSIVAQQLSFNPLYLKHPSMLYTLISSMFIHYDVVHLLGNMIALFFIGIPFEHRAGTIKVWVVYVFGGIIATLFFSLANFNYTFLMGASGAIFSLLGGFAAAFPRDKILVPVPLGIVIFVKMNVVTAAIVFGLLQIFFSLASPYSHIAYMAHLGGLVGGIFIARLIIREKKEKEHKDYSYVKKLIKNERQMEIFNKIQEAKEPEIKEAWLSYLVKDLRCPYCNGKLELKNGRLYCKRCGYIK